MASLQMERTMMMTVWYYVSCPDKVCGKTIYAFPPSEMIMSYQKLSLKSTNLLENRKAFIAIAPPSNRIIK